jgi:hypothetical protein
MAAQKSAKNQPQPAKTRHLSYSCEQLAGIARIGSRRVLPQTAAADNSFFAASGLNHA